MCVKDLDPPPIYHAIMYGKHEVAKKLLSLHSCDISKYLFLACHSQSLETVKLVLENGADVNQITNPFEVP